MYERRLRRLLIGFCALFGVLAVHVALLQVGQIENLAAAIDATRPYGIRARRGEILWADGSRMAANVPGYGMEIVWDDVDDRLMPTVQAFRGAIAARVERERDAAAGAMLRERLERRRVQLAEAQRTTAERLVAWRTTLVERLELHWRPGPDGTPRELGIRWECRVCGDQTKHAGPPARPCGECGVAGEWDEVPLLDVRELASLLETDEYGIHEGLILAAGRRADHPSWRSHAFRVLIPAHAAEAVSLAAKRFAGFEPLARTSRDVDPVAHMIVGSTRLPSEDDFRRLCRPSRRDSGLHKYTKAEVYPLRIGASLLERRFDELLRGVPGAAQRVRRPENDFAPHVEVIRPVADGEDLRTTLRRGLQTRAAEIVARAPEGSHASAVVLDVRTGAVLALASSASDGMNHARSHVAPGSVYKLITAVAALEAGSPPEETRLCEGSARLPTGGRYKCEHTDGEISLVPAFARSCNGYFAQQSAWAGIDAMVGAAERLGLGERHLVDELGTDQSGPGGLPLTRAALADACQADLPFLGIGQGKYGSATPLQIAVAYSRIANGGRLVRPWLLERNRPAPGSIPVDPILSRWSPVLCEAAGRVVTEGTAARIAQLVGTGGKTGTAEIERWIGGEKVLRNNAWFVGFAPQNAPRYCAVVVFEDMSEGQFGADVAGVPVAELLIEAAVAQ